MLKIAIGYGTNLIEAKERAIFFYDRVEGTKYFRFVETQTGYNEIGEQALITTIWFEVPDPTPEEKKEKEEEHWFIGSTDIDPNDPDWYDKWQNQQDASKEQAQEGA